MYVCKRSTYTEGLIEAENAEDELYSIARLEAAARAHLHEPASQIAEAIYASVLQFRLAPAYLSSEQ